MFIFYQLRTINMELMALPSKTKVLALQFQTFVKLRIPASRTAEAFKRSPSTAVAVPLRDMELQLEQPNHIISPHLLVIIMVDLGHLPNLIKKRRKRNRFLHLRSMSYRLVQDTGIAQSASRT